MINEHHHLQHLILNQTFWQTIPSVSKGRCHKHESSTNEYSRFRVYSPVCPSHTAITHVIKVLEPLSSCKFSSEALQFQYFNHASDCSVQCTNETRDPGATVYVCTNFSPFQVFIVTLQHDLAVMTQKPDCNLSWTVISPHYWLHTSLTAIMLLKALKKAQFDYLALVGQMH